MHALKRFLERILSPHAYDYVLSWYHYALAYVGALLYRFPSRHIPVIAVTGTKGKSSTTEIIAAIFEEAGWNTAVVNTIRFKVGADNRRNTTRMTTPGRFFLQRFLRRAVDNGCEIAIIEMSSEAARQHRHRFIALDALVFTNLAPEHIESHGSFDAYVDAKLSIAREVVASSKRPRVIVANLDDTHGPRFLQFDIEQPLGYSLENAQPYTTNDRSGTFTFQGTTMRISLPGRFSLYNALAAATLAESYNISIPVIARGLAHIAHISGRAERIEEGQAFPVIVDYAHTPDSLEALYEAFEKSDKICVFGSMGGGRDTWKRPEMGRIAGTYCSRIILTNEDPCDDDPEIILQEIADGIPDTTPHEIILDRRTAIRKALEYARANSAVLITGKGTDATMKLAGGTSIPWSDAEVAREELRKLQSRGT